MHALLSDASTCNTLASTNRRPTRYADTHVYGLVPPRSRTGKTTKSLPVPVAHAITSSAASATSTSSTSSSSTTASSTSPASEVVVSKPRISLAKRLQVELSVDPVLLGVSLLLSGRVRNVVEEGRLFVVELFCLLVLGHFLLELLNLVGGEVKGLRRSFSRLPGLPGFSRLSLSLLPGLSRLSGLLARLRSCLSRGLLLYLRLCLRLGLLLRLSGRLNLHWCSCRRLVLCHLLGLLLGGLLGLEFGFVLG